jgi:hypothetical protein
MKTGAEVPGRRRVVSASDRSPDIISPTTIALRLSKLASATLEPAEDTLLELEMADQRRSRPPDCVSI